MGQHNFGFGQYTQSIDPLQGLKMNPVNLSLAGSNIDPNMPGGNTGMFAIGNTDALTLNGVKPPPSEFNVNDAIGNFSLGAQGISGLAGAYTAYQQLGMLKEQLALQKGVANRNISNSAATTNRSLADRASMAAQLTTGADYGTTEYLKAKEKLQTTVDGSPVG